jgi:hypothetical protein
MDAPIIRPPDDVEAFSTGDGGNVTIMGAPNGDAAPILDAEVTSVADPEPDARRTAPIPIVDATLVDAVDAGYAPDSVEASVDIQTIPLSAEELRRKTTPPDLTDLEAPSKLNAE